MAAVLPIYRGRRRRERNFRARRGFEDLTEEEIVCRYRLNRQAILQLVRIIEIRLMATTNRSSPVPVLTKVLVCLRYLAKGDFLSEVSDLHGISRSSSSRITTEVVEAINATVNNIRFPEGREVLLIKQAFYQKCHLPNVVGAVDGTLVPILAPEDHPEAFICRKGFPALNIQAVVDHTGRFRDVVARWPGSTHDASVFDNSGIKEFLQQNQNFGHLLGDSGYPLKQYLLTPLLQPLTEAERRFNEAHIGGRTVVERSFGQFKSRFRCLHKTGGCLMSKPRKCCHIVMACMRLHNLCKDFHVPDPEAEDDVGEDIQEVPQGDNGAIGHRRAIVQLFA